MLLSVIVWSVSNMIILTYLVRTILVLMSVPLGIIMYSLIKQLADKEQW